MPYSDPSYIFSVVKTPNPQDLRHCSQLNNHTNDQTHITSSTCQIQNIIQFSSGVPSLYH